MKEYKNKVCPRCPELGYQHPNKFYKRGNFLASYCIKCTRKKYNKTANTKISRKDHKIPRAEAIEFWNKKVKEYFEGIN